MTTRADRGRLSEALWPAVVGGVFFGPAMQVSDVLLFGEVWSWFGAVVRSVFFAVAMGLGLAVQYRFSAAGRERAAVSRAVSAGILPESADAGSPSRPTQGGGGRRPRSGDDCTAAGRACPRCPPSWRCWSPS